MSYPGGKGASGVAQTIINQQPPHDWYVEPFLGGGSIYKAKRAAQQNTLIDKDPDAWYPFAAASRDVPGLEVLLGDSIGWMRRNAERFTSRTLIYCDPPYPFAARMRARRLYRCELDDSDHVALLSTLRDLDCMVQVSSYWNGLYAEMLHDWRLIRFPAMTRGGLMEECLWMNYPTPGALHDYRYLGCNYRERERITRKTQRWVSRVAKMPELERLALYSAISAEIAGNGERCRPQSQATAVRPGLVDSSQMTLLPAMPDLTGVGL